MNYANREIIEIDPGSIRGVVSRVWYTDISGAMKHLCFSHEGEDAVHEAYGLANFALTHGVSFTEGRAGVTVQSFIPPHRVELVRVSVSHDDSSQPEAQDRTDPYPDTSLDKESPLSGSS